MTFVRLLVRVSGTDLSQSAGGQHASEEMHCLERDVSEASRQKGASVCEQACMQLGAPGALSAQASRQSEEGKVIQNKSAKQGEYGIRGAKETSESGERSGGSVQGRTLSEEVMGGNVGRRV